MALMIELPMVSLVFVWVEALRPSQQFFSHVRTFSWVAPILSNEDEVSCSRTQHRTLGDIRNHSYLNHRYPVGSIRGGVGGLEVKI